MNSRIVISALLVVAAPCVALAQLPPSSVSPKRANNAEKPSVPQLNANDQIKGGTSQREVHGLIGGAIGFVTGAVITHIAFRNIPGGCDASTAPCNYAAEKRKAWWAKTAVGGVVGFSFGAVIGAVLPHDADRVSQKQADEK